MAIHIILKTLSPFVSITGTAIGYSNGLTISPEGKRKGRATI